METISRSRSAFTLIDLLAIVAIVCILIALTLPAIQQSREAARRDACRDNLKKLGLALFHYESSSGCLPPTSLVSRMPDGSLWRSRFGPFVRTLPYFEQSMTYNAMNINILYGELADLPVVAHLTRAFLCPSEPRGDQVADTKFGGIGGVSYGFSMGNWLVADGLHMPSTETSVFGVNLNRPWSDFSRGLGQTVLMSEVKFQQAYLTNPSFPTDEGAWARLSKLDVENSTGVNPGDLVPEYQSPSFQIESNGHARWMDSAVEQIGFTTAWTPNRMTPAGERNRYPDVDLVGRTGVANALFAAVTSRSHHQGGVNSLFGDGSVKFVSSSVEGRLWRTAGSIAGPETVSPATSP